MTRLLLLTVLVLSATAGLLSPAQALAVTDCPDTQSTSWTNPNGGFWSEPTNWSNGVPGGGCTATITLAGTYTVVVDTGGAALALTVGGASGKQTLQIAGSTTNANQPRESLFTIGTGDLTVAANGVLQFTAIGANPGAATMTGAGEVINSGLVRTDDGSGAGTRDIQPDVTNNAGGTIALHASTVTCGCGNTHHWTNHGTITTDPSTTNTLSGTAAGVLFTQDGGTFTNNGHTRVSGTVTHTGGTTTGNPIEVCGTLDAPGPGSASFVFENLAGVCQGGEFGGDVGPDDSVEIHNTVAGQLIVSTSVNFTNHGTITFDGTAGSGESFITNGHTLTNASDGTIELAQPGSTQFQVPLTNNGTIDVAAGNSFDVTGTTTQAAGSFNIAAGGSFGSGTTVNLTGGTVANSGTWQQGGQLHHTGGTTSGNALKVCGGDLYPSGPGTAHFQLTTIQGTCSSGGVQSDIGSGDTVDFNTPSGTADYFNPTFTNHGTMTSSGAGTTQLHSGNISSDGTISLGGAQTNIAGVVTNTGTMTVAPGASAGVFDIALDGGALNVDGALGVSSAITQSGGTTTVDGTFGIPDSLALTGGTLRGGGTVSATSGVTNSGATVHPGHSPGTLSITGDYTQTGGGTLAVDVAGAAAGSGYSQLAVSGNAQLAGALSVTTTAPQTGDLRILTASAVTGTFAPVSFTGQTDAVSYDATGVTLSATAPPTSTAPPEISGSPTVGSTLSATQGSWSGAPTSFAYQWRACDASGASCTDIAGAAAATYTLAASDVGRTIRVAVTATNAGGSGTAESAQTAVVSGADDTQAPVVESFTASPSKFTAGTKAKHGTSLKYTLSEAAQARFTVARRSTGRRAGKRCVKPTRANRHAKKCSRFTTVGHFAVASDAGANRHRFSGLIGSKKLAPGAYRLTVVATDTAGNRSKPRSTNVKVVRR